MASSGEFELRSEMIGPLPVVNHFLSRMRIAEILQKYLPNDDARLRLAPAAVIGVLVRNIVVCHRPVYAISEWAMPYHPGVLGLAPGDPQALNDDRLGRTLDRLFDADRATLITETVLGVLREFSLEVSQLHNDSTTITLSGSYIGADGRARGAKATPAIVHGHNKDFRPDLKQLLFILSVSADGAVPIAYRTADGNTPDDVTHIPTWDELVRLVGRADFLYVADSKLCSAKAMGHIARGGGRFVTIIPHGRKEVIWFRDWAQNHVPAWEEADRRSAERSGDPDRVWRTFEAPMPSVDGYRVIWVHSSAKAACDSAARAARIEAGFAAIEALGVRLLSPRSRLKSVVAVTQAAEAALAEARAQRWVNFTVTESMEVSYRKERRGPTDPSTRYRRIERPVFVLSAQVRAETVAYDAVGDGCFPLITNDRVMTPAEVLRAYRYQPNLERRNHILKGPQEVAPVYLETPHRIEALLLCHFFAMLAEALIEREIRASMKAEDLTGIPLYPELRNCPAPSAPRILEIFGGIQRHCLVRDGNVVQVFEPELTPLQQKVLDLLHVPANIYTSASTT